MKYAVLERTLPSENGTIETLYEAGEAGFDGIALQIDKPNPDEHLAWSPAGRAKLREVAVEAGIEIMSVCPSFYWKGWEGEDGFISDTPALRRRAIKELKFTIDAAGALGAELVLLPFFREIEITELKHTTRVTNALTEVVDSAGLIGVTITLETSLAASKNAEIIDAVDSPHLKVCYDAANKAALYGYDEVEEVRLLGNRIGEYHVKDFHKPPPKFPKNYAALGQGAVDQEGVAEALREFGYDGWAMLETEVGKPLDYTSSELKYTKALFEN
jgi:sugar phosphate isomerase/epimerase